MTILEAAFEPSSTPGHWPLITEKRMSPARNRARDRHLGFVTKSVFRHLDPKLHFVPSGYPFVTAACLSNKLLLLAAG